MPHVFRSKNPSTREVSQKRQRCVLPWIFLSLSSSSHPCGPIAHSSSSLMISGQKQQQQQTTTISSKMGFSWLLFALLPTATRALFAEDAGQLDFLVASAGHKAVQFAQFVDDDSSSLVVTSDATETLESSAESSCYIAAKSFATGDLVWRRNVCSADEASVAVASLDGAFVTLDSAGAVRRWNAMTGNLEWEARVEMDTAAAYSLAVSSDVVAILQNNDQTVAILDAATGKASQGTAPAFAKKSIDWVSCVGEKNELTVAIDKDTKSKLVTTTAGNQPAQINDISVPEGTTLQGVFLLTCPTTDNVDSSMSILVSTSRGTTTVLKIEKDTSDVASYRATVQWEAEEGLAAISAGLLLDAGHHLTGGSSGADLLSASARLGQHVNALSELLAGVDLINTPLAQEFGFQKVAALVSSTSHRLYGMATTASGTVARGDIQYQLDLPVGASWHRLVHGIPNALKTARGIHGKAHTREILVVSSSSSTKEDEDDSIVISWMCVDATTGSLQSQGDVGVTSPVTQIVPIPGSSGAGSCRQGAILVLQDLSTVVLPQPKGDTDSEAVAASYVAASNTMTNGFFAHRLDKENASLESLRLLEKDQNVVAMVSGLAQFPGEKILSVAYPNREEVIQSPCNVLGDQSLLLKYLNPHMVVIMTMTSTTDSDKDDFTAAMKAPAADSNNNSGGTKQKRKPAGAGGPGDAQPVVVDEEPNLFINVIDSVSGRVLYRASHSNAVVTPEPSLLVSENWIFYSFMNSRTRRSEVGVLSLYEGMIDNKGLTAFNTPEQSAEFSSLDARESKPVVLAKSYSVAKPIAALGVTSTRGGISAKMLVVSCLDGQIFTVDRKVLEPRRPLGQVKDTEKEEGLRQYSELIPLITYLSLSYTQTIEGVKRIVSAPTDLESQSLVMAFGGPDIFFARTSPSRGFDLLPDSFNRVMLSIVVVVLLFGATFLQRVVFSKTVKKGWV